MQGELDFHVPTAGKPCKTWYTVVGDLNSSKTPLIALHGGPGGCHDYMLPMGDLAKSHNTPVIFYDQLGNGNSTHLREKNGDGSFWTVELFLDELDNLITQLHLRHRGYHLLGHSWGGMLAAKHATRQPAGLKKLVISNSPASLKDWIDAATILRDAMPPAINEALKKYEDAEDFDNPEYKKAVDEFYKRHVCRIYPFPKEVQVCFQRIEEDPTVYMTMNGPSEFHVIGTLKTWSVIDSLHNIKYPTLLLNGGHDEALDQTLMPYFQRISAPVKWCRLENSAHMAHIEERGRYIAILGGFLEKGW